MSDYHRFIVHYPPRDDPNYVLEMGTKLEFRELLLLKDPGYPNEDDPFFYNYQMLVGRWWGPWTNNRIGLLRWDPGSGKTRGAFIWALMHMRYSNHKKTIFISNSDIVLRAIEDEVVKYNNYDVELERGTYKQGRRGHGKTIRKSRYVKKQGFERYNIVSFMNGARTRFAEAREKGLYNTIEEYLRDAFKDYNVIVDEVHGLRGVTKEKQQYNDIITFLDAVRGQCPILLMTATPVVNTWKDIFSIIGMLHPPEVRRQIQNEIKSISTYTKDPREIQRIDRLVYQYSLGLVSDRKSTGVVPDKVALPGPFNFGTDGQIKFSILNNENSDDEEVIDLEENIYPLFMSNYQTEFTARMEGKDGLDDQRITNEAFDIIRELSAAEEEERRAGINLNTSNNLYLNLRQAYDFATPFEYNENGVAVSMKMSDLVYQDTTTKHYYPTNTAILRRRDEPDENIFLVSWRAPTQQELDMWNDAFISYYERNRIDVEDDRYVLFTMNNVLFPRTDTGLGRYSIKYAMLIWMMRYHPQLQAIPGYVHTLWVEMGTKLIAAALNTNGWEQYVGNQPADSPSTDTNGNVIPRFAIIDGNTKSTHITRIIETFNSPKNRDGSILRMVLGSKKSGISISLTNGRFFIELSPDFNKTTRIQSEGRVFRADSLSWMRQLGLPRQVFTADILALPSIDVEDEESEEINEQYISDIRSGFLKNRDYDAIQAVDPVDGSVRPYTINPVTIETRMYQLSEIKHSMGKVASEALRRASIEEIIDFHKNRPADTTTHALLYGGNRRREIRENILSTIPEQWVYRLDPRNMYEMRTTAELVSNHTLATTRYGMPRPIQSFSNIVTATRDPQVSGNTYQGGGMVNQVESRGLMGTPSSLGQLSLIYERNFFLVEEQKGYASNAVQNTISLLMRSPVDRFDFYRYLADANVGDSKAIALEMALAMPEGVLTQQEMFEFNRRRNLILSLFQNFWDAFGGGRVVHVLWYGIKSNSYLSKLGINNTPSLKTRILTYDLSTNPNMTGSTQNRWRYIESTEREAVYLSNLSRRITQLEEAARDRAQPYGYYVHFSIYDGELRLREIYMEDKRKSKTFVVDLNTVPEVISAIMDAPIDSLRARYGNNLNQFRREFFNRAEQLGILIIR